MLSRGETNASSQQSGNSPDVREQLIMRLMTGSRTSRQETTSDVGAGSSGQDFFADCQTSFGSSFSLIGQKASSAFSGPTSGSSGKTMFCTRVDGPVNIRADGFYFADKKISDVIRKNRFIRIARKDGTSFLARSFFAALNNLP